ncbi:MAG: hypothetical protein ACFFB0_02230 [Promethearchaeota archaeon]
MRELKLRVRDIFKEDKGKDIARVDPAVFTEFNLNTDDIIQITDSFNENSTAAKVYPSDLKDKGKKVIRIDAFKRRNIGISVDDIVIIKKTKIALAQQVSFAGYKKGIILKNPKALGKKLNDKLVSKGYIFTFQAGSERVDLIVINHTPETEVVRMHPNTAIYCQEKFYDKIT